MVMKRLKKYLTAPLVLLCAFLLCYSNVLYGLDKLIADPLYQRETVTNNSIKIIAIDEKTIAAYGDPKTWTRDIPARLLGLLNGETSPAVIAFDIMYVGAVEQESDAAFALAAAEAENVVTAVNVVRETDLQQASDGSYVASNRIELVEYPYEALKEGSSYGFANAVFDRDGYIRHAQLSVDYEGETIYSFPAAVYSLYCQRAGVDAVLPETFDDNVFAFSYSGRSGAYETVSLCDVLDGRIDPRAFAGAIVFVGAYAPGMQDSYAVPIQKDSQMYGVEIQANILEALMEGKTATPANLLLYSAAVALVFLACFLVIGRLKPLFAVLLCVVGIAADLVLGRLLYDGGTVVSIIELPILLLLLLGYRLISGYLSERLKRHRVVQAFKKYVAPQVVEQLSKKDDFSIVLGGENREIAVLFVDIRGFTPLSESLQPEQVVEILNEYLSLTTNAIFKNGGTLDKFIGDATMAVFNAPFDLDDYVYRAVCTALDIASGSKELEDRLQERFGRKVSFGIGVNCGNAVVGNIGCDFRMDYTAIGDTVNTAARLESNAAAGQILISEAVFLKVRDRVIADEVGEIPLKGKQQGVFVYSLKGLKTV
ncbi:MAG: adenylate/guanylate cyclase domain-containing protein [Clostridia bacterium]|nr:adenylate/guanylate cyclase domain-containing protein [Clostridia bacterium]